MYRPIAVRDRRAPPAWWAQHLQEGISASLHPSDLQTFMFVSGCLPASVPNAGAAAVTGEKKPVNADHGAHGIEPFRPPSPDTRWIPPDPRDQQQHRRSARWQPQDRSDLATPVSARTWARQILPELLEHPVSDDLAYEVELLLGELCTNAVRHGDGLDEVHLHCVPPTVRVTVSDRNPAPPVLYDHTTDPNTPVDHGRGLLLIQAIASRWGVDHRGDVGKDVWCELHIHRPPTAQG